jgi:hypothetical protein
MGQFFRRFLHVVYQDFDKFGHFLFHFLHDEVVEVVFDLRVPQTIPKVRLVVSLFRTVFRFAGRFFPKG